MDSGRKWTEGSDCWASPSASLTSAVRFASTRILGEVRFWQSRYLMNTIRILLADDHVVMRRGIRALLERRPDFQVVAEAGDGREAVELTEAHSPHVVVADIAMPNL